MKHDICMRRGSDDTKVTKQKLSKKKKVTKQQQRKQKLKQRNWTHKLSTAIFRTQKDESKHRRLFFTAQT
jgi:predicted solute-binding protein